MRLRQSNKKKQFELPDYGLDLDATDGESTLPRVDSSEDEFVIDAAAKDDDEADEARSGQEEDDDNGDDDDGEDELTGRSGQTATKTAKYKGKKGTGRSKQYVLDNPEQVFAEVPPYPSDPGQRWTRTYIGPVKRWTRFYELIDWWFGDKPNRRTVLDGYLRLWWQHELIPPKLTSPSSLLMAQNGWMPDNFANDQRSKFRQFYNSRLIHQLRQQSSTCIDKTRAFGRFIPRAEGGLSVFMGHVSDQKPYSIQPGESISFSDTGRPIGITDDEEAITGGWLLDVGGIPIAVSWAPTQGRVNQLLAIAVAPFSDQAYYQDTEDSSGETERKEGTVQILKFETVKDRQGILRPSRRTPELAKALCFSWGRVSRIQWCPVALATEDTTRLLGVLCDDGRLRIVGVRNDSEENSNATFEEIEDPMVIIEPPQEYSIEITCFTWINMNRVVAGLSDGSVVLWSISPLRLLQRHAVHSTAIMDIVSGYPSDPFIISTVPIGGVLTVTDLGCPSAETTYHPNMMVSLQPNLLAWSPHLRGFASIWPSAFAGNPNLTFLPVRGFPLCRHLITVSGQPTCISVGPCHPYILTGTTDGSVWVFNTLRKLSSHREKTLKVKLFQHEFRPPPSSNDEHNEEGTIPRGACRILHAFLPEPNSHPTGVKMAETQRLNREKNAEGGAKGNSQGSTKGNSAKSQTKTDQPDGETDEEAAMTTGPGPIVLHEPQTRITSVAWNPNVEFSWWAAAAMGSGLVRVMDVGTEPEAGPLGHDTAKIDGADKDGRGLEAINEDDDEDGGDEDVEMALWED